MTDKRLTRRRMIQATTGAAIAGLAGCAGAPTSSISGGSSSSQGTKAAEQHGGEGESNHEEAERGHNEESHSESKEENHSDDGHGHGESVGSPSDTAKVSMLTQGGGYHFEPHVVRVNVGGTVMWGQRERQSLDDAVSRGQRPATARTRRNSGLGQWHPH